MEAVPIGSVARHHSVTLIGFPKYAHGTGGPRLCSRVPIRVFMWVIEPAGSAVVPMSASADDTIDLDVLLGRNDIAVVFHFTFLSVAHELVFDGCNISFAGALSDRSLHSFDDLLLLLLVFVDHSGHVTDPRKTALCSVPDFSSII